MSATNWINNFRKFLIGLFHNIKTYYQKEAECNHYANDCNSFLRHYEILYREYQQALIHLENADMHKGAVLEAEYIGKKYFGLCPDAYYLIRYKVENE